jgi:hypothetical protein
MAKLHELLAVLPDREKAAKAILDETTQVLKSKQELFMEQHRSLALFEEAADMETPEEHISMTSTVPDKLRYMRKSIAKLYDALLQQESTNQQAVADLVVDGKVLLEKVPATFLLNMEKRLVALREVLLHTPTLASGRTWVLDEQKGTHIYRDQHPEKVYKTRKDIVFKVVYEATKEHPAQIEKWTDTREIGMYTREVWCSMLSSADKSQMLSRLDNLLHNVRRARQRANNTDVVKTTIGDKIFDYIFQDFS